jgi:hypothetical protein
LWINFLAQFVYFDIAASGDSCRLKSITASRKEDSLVFLAAAAVARVFFILPRPRGAAHRSVQPVRATAYVLRQLPLIPKPVKYAAFSCVSGLTAAPFALGA